MPKLFWILTYRYFIFPLMFASFFVLSFFNSKVKKGFKIRKKVNNIYPWLNFPKNSKPIWFHCSSGEFEYAKPIIRKLKEFMPDQKILVTYFSPTYEDNIQSFPGVDMCCPLPWDSPRYVKEFLNHHNPKCHLVTRTDLWPEILVHCESMGILSLLYSATLSPKSPKLKNKLNLSFYQWVYSYLNSIFCVSDKDKTQLEKLTDPLNIRVTGDTRFDQVIERLKNSKTLKTNLNPNLKNSGGIIEKIGFKKETPIEKIFLAGSTWPEDEKIIFPALFKHKEHIWFILAPHEPTPSHIEKIQNQLKRMGWDSTLYSEARFWNKGSVLIVDQMGILADLYKWAHFAFVGGSFKKSVHSVMEPLAAGCLTFVGPFNLNNSETQEFKTLSLPHQQTTVTAVQEFQTPDQLEKLLKKYYDFIDLNSARQFISNEVLRKSGTSDAVIGWIQRITSKGS